MPHRAHHGAGGLGRHEHGRLPVILGDGVTETRDHWWWRPGWHVGQRAYTWHLTFDDATSLYATAAAYRPVLERFVVNDVIPRQWLHLTMNGVGFCSEVDDAQVREVADGVREGLFSDPIGVLTFESLMVVDEGVLLSARRDEWLLRLSGLQRRVVDQVCGPRSWPDFWPHVSLSYTHGVEDARTLQSALAEVDLAAHGIELPVQVALPRVTLMRINRDQHCYRWDVVAQF